MKLRLCLFSSIPNLSAALLASISLPLSASGELLKDRLIALEARTDSLRAEAKYAEALDTSRELLRLMQEDKEAKAYAIADARMLVETLEFLAGLPTQAQRELAKADRWDTLIENHFEKGEYDKGLVLARKQLEIRRRILGKEHRDAARSLDNLAAFLQEKGDLEGAERFFREALTMRRKLLGSENPEIAASLNKLALLFWTRGDYASAEPLYREALALRRKLLGDEHPAIAQSVNNLAGLLWARGDFAGAEPLFRETLGMLIKLFGNEHPYVSTTMNNLASILRARGNYGAAEPLLREALSLSRKLFGDEHPDVAIGLSNLAVLFYAKGDYAKAEPLFREALAMFRKLFGNEHPKVATCLNNLGLLLRDEGEYAAAEPLFREALGIRRQVFGSGHPNVAGSISNLALLLQKKGDLADAEPLFREALAMARQILGSDHPMIAKILDNLALLLQEKWDYAGAEPLLREALAIRRKALGDEHLDVATSLKHLAGLLYEKQDYHAAEELLSQAAHIYEAARLRVGTGIARATFMPSPYRRLAAARLNIGRSAQAWPAAEGDLGRALADLLLSAGKRKLTPSEVACEDSLKRTLGNLESKLEAYQKAALRDTTEDATKRVQATRDKLLAAEARWSAFQDEISRKYPITEGQAYSLRKIQSALDKRSAIIGWLDVEEAKDKYSSWAYLIPHHGPVLWANLGESKEKDLSPFERARLFRDALTSPSPLDIGVRKTAEKLYQKRIAPLSHALRGIKNLIAIPSGAMLGVPLEALIDQDGSYMHERFTISYAPSATIYAWLKERSREAKKPTETLLIGDPPFRGEHLASMEEEAPVLAASEPLPEASTLRSALAGNEQALASLPRLPATRGEVARIASIAPKPTTLLGPEASEQELFSMALSGELAQFSTLHIATHALVDDEVPERSTLVLSRVDLPDPLEAAMAGERIFDGLVSAKEILREWKLDADLVTLSACETGLGKKLGGEGYIGFSHAFLQAGTRSLLVSLWKVEDRATSLLMERFYENLWGKYKDKRLGSRGRVMTKAKALKEAKDYLKSYTDTEGNKPFAHPYYWSAFVLIGERG